MILIDFYNVNMKFYRLFRSVGGDSDQAKAVVEATFQVQVSECLGGRHLALGRDLRSTFRILNGLLDLNRLRLGRLNHWLRPLRTWDELSWIGIGNHARWNLPLLVYVELDRIEQRGLEEQDYAHPLVGQLLRAEESLFVSIQRHVDVVERLETYAEPIVVV